MEPDEHISALELQGALLAAAAGRRGLGAPVPGCPGWQVRLTGFAPRARFQAQAGSSDSPPRLLVQAADTGDAWLTEIGSRITAQRCADPAQADPARADPARADPAQCVVAGPASDLYLALWNRQPVAGPVALTGDAAVLALWQARIQVRW